MKKTEFIKIIAPYIMREGNKRGYKIYSPIIAQAIIESNWGQSGLAEYNNFFGMKCGSKWKGKSVNMKTREEYTPGTLTTIKDNFRAYDSIEDGIKGYFDFISTSRYENLKKSRTPYEYCLNLKNDGYATSSKYVNTLMNTINKHELYLYDDVSRETPLPIEQVAMEVIDGKWGDGIDRKNRLHAYGYDYAEVQKLVNEIVKGQR